MGFTNIHPRWCMIDDGRLTEQNRPTTPPPLSLAVARRWKFGHVTHLEIQISVAKLPEELSWKSNAPASRKKEFGVSSASFYSTELVVWLIPRRYPWTVLLLSSIPWILRSWYISSMFRCIPTLDYPTVSPSALRAIHGNQTPRTGPTHGPHQVWPASGLYNPALT